MRNRALAYYGPGRIEVVEEELREPSPGEMLVRLGACGVCRFDLNVYSGTDSLPFPHVGGHEGVGIVEAVGEKVLGFSPGDAVALLGDRRFSEYALASPRQAAALPAGASDDWTRWIVEPVACCVNGVDVAHVSPDDVVSVIGCGFMGQLILQLLRRSPCRLALGLDVRDDRLAQATANGADHTFRSDSDETPARIDALVSRREMPAAYASPELPNGPVDVVFETSGTQAGLDLATRQLRVGGTLVMFGHQHGRVEIDGTAWHMKGLRVLNASPMIADDFLGIFHRTVGLLASARVTLDGLVSHTAGLDAAESVFAAAGDPGYVKGAVLL